MRETMLGGMDNGRVGTIWFFLSSPQVGMLSGQSSGRLLKGCLWEGLRAPCVITCPIFLSFSSFPSCLQAEWEAVAMSDFVESEAEESEEEYNDEGEVVPRVTKKFVEEEDDGEEAPASSFSPLLLSFG